MPSIGNAIERLKAATYARENGRLPRTTIDVALALLATVAVGLYWPPAGIVVFAASIVAIYVRRIVPAAPALTDRRPPSRSPTRSDAACGTVPDDADQHGPDVTGEAISGATSGRDGPGATDEDSSDGTAVDPVGEFETTDVEVLLATSNVVEECEDGPDLCLQPAFQGFWWEQIRAYRDGDVVVERLADRLGTDPDRLSLDGSGDRFELAYEGETIGRWDSDAAFYADIATEVTLSQWIPEWDVIGEETRRQLISGLRAFLEECPACDGNVDRIESVRTGRRAHDLVCVSAICEDCGARVFDGTYRPYTRV